MRLPHGRRGMTGSRILIVNSARKAYRKKASRRSARVDQGLAPSEAIYQDRSDSGCGAEKEAEATQTVKMVALSQQRSCAPEFHTCAVEVTPAQRASGDHYEMAEDNAVDNGYEPQFAFEENDPAAKQMGEIHVRGCDLTAHSPVFARSDNRVSCRPLHQRTLGSSSTQTRVIPECPGPSA